MENLPEELSEAGVNDGGYRKRKKKEKEKKKTDKKALLSIQ